MTSNTLCQQLSQAPISNVVGLQLPTSSSGGVEHTKHTEAKQLPTQNTSAKLAHLRVSSCRCGDIQASRLAETRLRCTCVDRICRLDIDAKGSLSWSELQREN